jgi:hypothetical protein
LTSPKTTFESVVSFPRWFGIFAITILLSTVVTTAFFWSPVGQDALRTQMHEQNPTMPDQQADMALAVTKFATPVMIPIGGLVVMLIIAGVLMGVFAITGGTASFKQVLAVVAHAGVVSTVVGIVNLAINYFRGSMVPVTSLAGVGQAFAEKGFLAGFFGAIDLVWFIYFFVLAIGLAVLYRRRTAPIFMSLTAFYLVIAIVIGAVKAAMAGGS